MLNILGFLIYLFLKIFSLECDTFKYKYFKRIENMENIFLLLKLNIHFHSCSSMNSHFLF